MANKFNLLTEQSPKTVKGEKLGFLTGVLYLRPADLSGWNVCPLASPGCKASCLNTAGRGRFDNVQDARQRRTERYFRDRAGFMADLLRDIGKLVNTVAKRGYKAAVRLNGTSDLPWHRVPCEGKASVFEHFADVISTGDLVVYDYTKVAKRLYEASLPEWYHLALSRSEANAGDVAAALRNGRQVSAVFRRDLPSTFLGAPVVDGDEHDLIFVHPAPCVLGLRAKGRAKVDDTGFTVDLT